jgi:hypothetical protein
MRGGDSGATIVIGKSGESELLRRVLSHDKDERMPPKGPRLNESEVAKLREWINAGAEWPNRDDYWAFQPPRDIEMPASAAANPIDRFIDAKLARENIAPVPPADPRTLLRHAFFGLIGMPPTLEETSASLNGTNASPDSACEKLVDRLLADSRYGERWARNWLDLARYAESDGYEDDKVRPLAWRYRDYEVRSFNADKPYDRFVQEQIAGREMWPDDSDAWIAMGFARLGT